MIGSAASRAKWVAVLATLVLGMLTAFASPARAETFTVTNTSDAGEGSLRQAIADANAAPGADEISFSGALAGRTVELASVGNPGAFPGPSALVITSEISIQGPASTEGVAIARASGAETPEMRLFYVAPGGDLTLENLTLSGGLARGGDGGDGGFDFVNDDYRGGTGGGGGAAGMGGAIFNEGSLTVEGGTLSGNTARGGDGGTAIREERGGGGGGGLATDGADGGVPGATLAYSAAGQGGDGGGPNGGEGAFRAFDFIGVFPGGIGGEGGGGGGGVSRIDRVLFGASQGHIGGAGGFGGGAGGSAGSTTAPDDFSIGGFGGGGAIGPGGFGGGVGDVFQGGGGSGMGGAIFNRGGNVMFTNSTLSGNTAVGGVMPGSRFTKNNGAGLGGGIFSVDGTVSVTNATIADNAGGGVHAHQRPQGERSGPSTFDLTNTILANNPGAPDCANGGGGAATGLSNLIGSNDGCADVLSNERFNLGPLADNGGPTRTHALLPGSSAINSAHTQGAPATDQRGVPRPQPRGGAADIGAYEYAPDTTPPAVTASVAPAPNQGGWNNSDATVTISAIDNRGGSGIEQVSYSASGAQQIPEQNVPGASAELVVSAEGETIVSYWATDRAGNRSAPRTLAVRVDKTLADTSIVSGPSGPTKNASASFGFSSTEAGSKFECSLDGSAFEACSSPKDYSALTDGDHAFEVRATDAAGNVDPTPASRAWTVDTLGPTVNGMSPRNALVTKDRTPTIRATVKDNPTNLQKDNVKLYVNGKSISPTKWRYSPTSNALVYNSPKVARGKKTVKIVATDAAGNVVTKSWYFRIR